MAKGLMEKLISMEEMQEDYTVLDQSEVQGELEELEDIDDTVDTLVEESDEAEEALESLNELITTLEAFKQEGGFDQKSAKLYNIAKENIYARLGAPVHHTLAMESLQDEYSQQTQIAIALEEEKGMFKRAWLAIVEAFQKVIDYIIEFFKSIFTLRGKLIKRNRFLRAKLIHVKNKMGMVTLPESVTTRYNKIFFKINKVLPAREISKALIEDADIKGYNDIINNTIKMTDKIIGHVYNVSKDFSTDNLIDLGESMLEELKNYFDSVGRNLEKNGFELIAPGTTDEYSYKFYKQSVRLGGQYIVVRIPNQEKEITDGFGLKDFNMKVTFNNFVPENLRGEIGEVSANDLQQLLDAVDYVIKKDMEFERYGKEIKKHAEKHKEQVKRMLSDSGFMRRTIASKTVADLSRRFHKASIMLYSKLSYNNLKNCNHVCEFVDLVIETSKTFEHGVSQAIVKGTEKAVDNLPFFK